MPDGSAGAIAVTPVVAVGISNVSTHADLGSGSLLTLTGAYSATATQSAGVDSTTLGDTTSNGAIGASVSVNHRRPPGDGADQAEPHGRRVGALPGSRCLDDLERVPRWAGTAGAPDRDTSTTGSVNALADGDLTMGNNLAGSKGAKPGKDAATPTASTADPNSSQPAPLSVAAAIAFNLVKTVSNVSLPGTVTLIVNGGPLTLEPPTPTPRRPVTARPAPTAPPSPSVPGSASTWRPSTTSPTSRPAPRCGPSTMGATMTPTGDAAPTSCDDADADCTHTIDAGAISASSGGGKLGLAGSVAINIVTVTTSAQVKTGVGTTTTIDARGGALTLAAHSGSTATASATPYRDAFDPAAPTSSSTAPAS